MPLSAVDVVSPAFERMKSHLFKPFRLGQWLRLALVGFLAGEMGQSGGCSVRLPLEILSERSNQLQGPLGPPRGPLFFVIVVLAFLLLLVLGIIFAYINSRMRFVLFDSIVNGECRIRDFWRRRGAPAFSYFLFQILLSVIGVLSVSVILGIPLFIAFTLGWFRNPGQHILGFVLGGIILFVVFFIWVVTMVLVQVLTKDFVVPQMAIDGVSVSEGWSRLWPMMKQNQGAYAGYVGMKLLLVIAGAVITGIASFAAMILLLIPFGGIGLVAFLMGRAAGMGWNPVTIAIAVVFATIAILTLIFLVCLIAVPSIVFFPAYAYCFFAERHPALRALLYPPPPESDVSTLSPQP